jgi:uncharacterized protein (DUF1501 family)
MDRRTFLRCAAAAGLTVTASPFVARRARASEPWVGPYWMFIHASGGWDPTMLCDPKGRVNELDPDPVNTFYVDEIGETGPFRYAPVDGHAAFFERFRDDLLVINGIDTQTNSHETGTRFTWSGKMDPGTPALSALIAAAPANRPSLSYLTHGGYDLTGALVAPTRLPDTSAVLEIAYPERTSSNDPDSELFTPTLMETLHTARTSRLQRQLDAATLPREKAAMSMLMEARSGDGELTRLAEVLPSSLDNSNNGLIRQAQVSLACFKAGVSVTASLSSGGFDTHGDHDRSHTPSMQRIVEAVSFIYDEAERQDIADQLIVVVGSDFGRTPWYNATNGKDHWSITSMMMMGPGIQGGRVIGATDPRQVPLPVNPNTLALDEGGIRITPGHIHAALRELAGIDGWEPAARFDVGDSLPLLG